MKNFTTYTFAFGFALLALTVSCTKEESTDAISTEEAADIVASAISENSSGATASVTDMSVQTDVALGYSTQNTSALKSISTGGYSKDTTIVRQSPQGLNYAYDYSFHYNFQLVMNNAAPESMSIGFDYSGDYETLRASSVNSGEGSIIITGLENTATQYIVNGTFTRDGSFQSKVRNKIATQSQLTITLTNQLINKSDYSIAGGTANVSITGSASGKGSFAYSATLTYNGDNTANLNINGNKYQINITTGDVTTIE